MLSTALRRWGLGLVGVLQSVVIGLWIRAKLPSESLSQCASILGSWPCNGTCTQAENPLGV